MPGASLGDYAKEHQLSKDQLKAVLERGRADPVWWMRHALGLVTWSVQQRIAESVRDNRKTCVPACHAAGKSAVAGGLVLWWMNNKVPSVAITTAPTERQVRRILWKEIRSLHKKSRFQLAGEPSTLSIEQDEEHWALGFATTDYDPNRFQGLHSDYLLVVLDEACGISPDVFDGVSGVMAGGQCRLLELGNPVDPNTQFREDCEDPAINTIPISAFDTPNFNIPGHELREEHFASGTWEERLGPYVDKLPYPYLTTPMFVDELYQRRGPQHPTYVARVLGRFPNQSEDSLLSVEEVDDAMRYEAPLHLVQDEPMVLAVDIARGGRDNCSMAGRQGPQVVLLDRWKKSDTEVSAMRVARVYDDLYRHGARPEELRIDVGGLGVGVFDKLYHMRTPWGSSYPVVRFDGSFQDGVPDDYENMRAWGYCHLQELFQARKIDIPQDDELRKQLLYIKTKERDGNSKILIMGKVEMRNRRFPSPDDADAVMMACAPSLRAPGDLGITI